MTPEALAQFIGAMIGGAVGALTAVKALTRKIAREESEATVVRMVRPEARTEASPTTEAATR